jgi:hypothetical protein
VTDNTNNFSIFAKSQQTSYWLWDLPQRFMLFAIIKLYEKELK